jgi:hypothetical protein
MDAPEFENMFGNMIESLMSKEVLYEPIKDLKEKVIDSFSRQSPSPNY